MNQIKKELKQNFGKAILIIFVLSILIYVLEQFNSWFFVNGPELLKSLFLITGIFSPIVFVVSYVLGNLFLVPSIPFTMTSGIVYGFWGGLILSQLSEIASATVNFFVARKVKDHMPVVKVYNKKIQKYKKYIDTHGFKVVFWTRFLGFYFDVISYAAGLTKIKYKDFIKATFLGFIPYVFIYVYAGYRLINYQSSDFMFYVLGGKLVVFLLAMGWWKYG